MSDSIEMLVSSALLVLGIGWLLLAGREHTTLSRQLLLATGSTLLTVAVLGFANGVTALPVQTLAVVLGVLLVVCVCWTLNGFVALLWPELTGSGAADVSCKGSLSNRKDESLRGFAELGVQWFWEMDDQLKFTFVSDRLEVATGISAKHILGRTAAEVRTSYFDENRAFDAALAILQNEEPFNGHDFVWTRDGVERILSISGRPRMAADGTFQGYFGIGRDVTRERRSLAAARDTEEKLKLLVDSLPVGIAYLGKDMHYQHSNETYRDWFSHEPDSTLTQHMRQLKGDELYEECLPAIECAMQGETVVFEEVLPVAESLPRHVQTTIVPHCRPGAEAQGLFMLSLDISNQKRQVDRLARTLRYLGSAMNGLDSALVVLNGDGYICSSNTAWDSFIALATAADVVHVNRYADIVEVYGEHASGNFSLAVDQVVHFAEGRGEPVAAEIRINHAGDERWYAISSSVFLNEEERYVLVSHEDITARLRMSRELNERNMALAQTARLSSVGELAATIAHELNQPLTALSNYGAIVLDMMENPQDSESAIKSNIDKMLRESRRAGAIVHRINKFVRQQPNEKLPVNVCHVIAEVLDSLGDLASETDTRLKASIACSDTIVKVDKSQLEQVIYNLVCNAIEAQSGQAAEATVDVGVKVHANGKDIQVCVTDNGQGLSDGIGQSVFDPFKSSKHSGLGLGLAICRSIIEDHGGRIWHQTDSQQRCQFCFALPLYKEVRAA